MKDAYNRTTFERNSIQTVPEGYIDHEANDLFKFMGSFWKNVHQGRDFIRGIQQVRGIRLAQHYLDLLETLKLQDRRGLPVFHRELWKPLRLRKSSADSSRANLLKLDNGMVLGEQPAGSKYGEGTELAIGGKGTLEGYVTYAVEDDIVEIVSGIANSVINPKTVYKVSTEFPNAEADVIYKDGTLIFPVANDPFREDTTFDVYDVADDIDGELVQDQEVVLWAADALIDKKYLADHMAYALGINCPSSELAKRIINAGWDALNCGLTPELIRTLFAAMLNIPVIQESEERILRILNTDDEKTVVTNRHTYTLYSKAQLRDTVRIGSTLHRGDILDKSVKIYPILTDVDAKNLTELTEYADTLEDDIPVLTLPKSILRTQTAYGLSVEWNPTRVEDTGELDANGHRKLWFEIGGEEEDVIAFWKDVWDHAERNNIDLETYFNDCQPVEQALGSSPEEWQIVPAKFFLKYMIGGNTLIVTVDTEQVEDDSCLRNPMFFDLLTEALPSGMRLFCIEHKTVEDDDYDTEELEDEEDDYAYDEAEDSFSDLPGLRGSGAGYDDDVEMKMFRRRKRSAE